LISKWISDIIIDRDAIIAVRGEMFKNIDAEEIIQNKAVKMRVFAFLTRELSRANKKLGI